MGRRGGGRVDVELRLSRDLSPSTSSLLKGPRTFSRLCWSYQNTQATRESSFDSSQSTQRQHAVHFHFRRVGFGLTHSSLSSLSFPSPQSSFSLILPPSISIPSMEPLPAPLRSLISSHTPIAFTLTTLQPYLPLSHPSLPNRLSLTLPRPSDLPAQLLALNHPSIYPQLEAPPYPYTASDAEWWNDHLLSRWRICCQRWGEGEGEGDFGVRVFAESGCPLGQLRLAAEGEEQGEGEWVGDLGVSRWEYKELPAAEGEVARWANEARKVGDEELVWSFGCALLSPSLVPCPSFPSLTIDSLRCTAFAVFLTPSLHGQQILTHALRSFLLSFLIPVLGARKIRSAAFVGNWGSRRVQEKCGLQLLHHPHPSSSALGGGEAEAAEGKEKVEEVRYQHKVVEAKGGGVKEVWVFGWEEGRDGELEGRMEGARVRREGEVGGM